MQRAARVARSRSLVNTPATRPWAQGRLRVSAPDWVVSAIPIQVVVNALAQRVARDPAPVGCVIGTSMTHKQFFAVQRLFGTPNGSRYLSLLGLAWVCPDGFGWTSQRAQGFYDARNYGSGRHLGDQTSQAKYHRDHPLVFGAWPQESVSRRPKEASRWASQERSRS